MFLVSKVVPTAFMLLYLPAAHQESSSLPLPLLLLPPASGDMLPTAASVLSTLHWPASWSPALEFRAWVVRSEVSCLSACLIQQEHIGPATLVCTSETLKELSGGFCGVKVRVCAARWGLAVCNVRTTQGCGWDCRGGIWSSLIVVVLYVWKELRAAGLFCQCVLVCRATCSWNNFRVKLERMRGGKAPAGEMWHNDKMVPMMGNHAMAPKGDCLSLLMVRTDRRGWVISSDRRKGRATGCIQIQVDTLMVRISKPILPNEHWGLESYTHLYSLITSNTYGPPWALMEPPSRRRLQLPH